jgi:hypothetical protein
MRGKWRGWDDDTELKLKASVLIFKGGSIFFFIGLFIYLFFWYFVVLKLLHNKR